MKYLLILLAIYAISCQIVSRNEKIQGMMQKIKAADALYDQLISKAQEKVDKELEVCELTTRATNCSELKVWQHQRAKHSKNITNMQDKIKNHQKTIYEIIELNNQETRKKALVINKMLPDLAKVKNDIEFIETMLFLIEDTYINIDVTAESILSLFDTHFGNPVQAQLAEILSRHKINHDPGAKPGQKDYLPEHPEEEPAQPKIEYNQGPPLIDEVIFDGHNEHYPPVKVDSLFGEEGEAVPAEPVADFIPDGVNVKQHDEGYENNIAQVVNNYKTAKENEPVFENLQIVELQEMFKQRIKELGRQMHERLTFLMEELKKRQDQYAQSIADLEKSILNLHHRHAQQIVQIYIESKRLQHLIFEKDDMVLLLDTKIHDCTNLENKVQKCQQNKQNTLLYIEDLKQQKSFNTGILKELQKLLTYEDKQVEQPVVVIPQIDQHALDKAEKLRQEIEKAQAEMQQIQAAEQEVGHMSEKQDMVVGQSLMMTGKHSLEENLSLRIEKDERELQEEMHKHPELEKKVLRESKKNAANFDIPVTKQIGGLNFLNMKKKLKKN